MRFCVFCGSKMGVRPAYRNAAHALGTAIARGGHSLVYGGASVGTMGVLADSAIAAGGHVIGVIPESLRDRELAHDGLGELHVVDSMHTRKALMAERADAFIALPGGTGTLEELFEVWTWSQLEMHDKPVALLDVEGYWQPLLRFLDQTVTEGFSRADVVGSLIVECDIAKLLERLSTPPVAPSRFSTPSPSTDPSRLR
ncbi:MAG: TIGR00730 family Rossman fold protein [Polyangiales bacterium]